MADQTPDLTSDVADFDLDKSTRQAWDGFASRLAEVVSVMDPGATMSIGAIATSDVPEPPLVTFTCGDGGEILAEAASNATLADDDQLHAGRVERRAHERAEALVVGEPAHREGAQASGAPKAPGLVLGHRGQPIRREAEGHDVALVPPVAQGLAGLEVGRRGDDHALGAVEHGALEEAVERVGEPERELVARRLDVRVPVHHPRQPARGGQEQRPERAGVGQVQVQDLRRLAGDAPREPRRKGGADGREDEPEPDGAAREPGRVATGIATAVPVDQHGRVVAGRALGRNEVAQEAFHAARHGGEVFPDVKDSHRLQGIARIFACHWRVLGLSRPIRMAASMSAIASALRLSPW